MVLARDGTFRLGPPPPPEAPLAPHYEQVLGMAVLGETMVAVGERAADRGDMTVYLTGRAARFVRR